MDLGLLAGVIALGVVHGVLPDHGWPIAAAYALPRRHMWTSGFIAGLVLGVGHLLSSVALVIAYYWVAAFAAFAEGPWLKPLAGGLLILLGIHEYLRGGHGHDHPEEAHHHDHDHHDERGTIGRLRDRLTGGHRHLDESALEGGLRTLGITAIVLGFAHEEPIQILAICAGTERCLELMLIYSLAVILAILAPTLLLIAGYQSHRERIEAYTPYLPALTAIVLIGVGSGFILGVF